MGMTLGEFAELFASQGCKTAYNLDGGGSSVMYSKGLVVNNPLGRGRERTNGDIIYVTSG
jgi:exopolysaccharide biosynthesis protein